MTTSIKITPTEKHARKLLKKYDAKRMELRLLEEELNRAVNAFATEQKFGWYDKDKLRTRVNMMAETRVPA